MALFRLPSIPSGEYLFTMFFAVTALLATSGCPVVKVNDPPTEVVPVSELPVRITDVSYRYGTLDKRGHAWIGKVGFAAGSRLC